MALEGQEGVKMPTKRKRKRPLSREGSGLTEDRESWLVLGRIFIDGKPFPFDSMEHAKEVWKAHKKSLMRAEYQFSWFGQGNPGEPRPISWGWWNFENPPEPKRTWEERMDPAHDYATYAETEDDRWHKEDETDFEYAERLGLKFDFPLEGQGEERDPKILRRGKYAPGKVIKKEKK